MPSSMINSQQARSVCQCQCIGPEPDCRNTAPWTQPLTGQTARLTSEPGLVWVRFLRSISFWMWERRRLSPAGMAAATASYPQRRASRSTITRTCRSAHTSLSVCTS